MKKIILFCGLMSAAFFHQLGYTNNSTNVQQCVAEVNHPQEPKRPYPYYEEEVSYENEHAGVKLAGTLTLPNSEETFPVVILIHGSAPLDRDVNLFGHKFFLVLADYLTKQGIGVLRFDKRGVGQSTGNYDIATSEDFASDVLAGVKYLKTRKEINPNQIGLLGHSEGGFIAPMVALKSKDVSFIIMFGGPGVNGEEIWLEQGVLLQRAVRIPEDLIDLDRTFRKLIIGIMKEESNTEIARDKIHKAIDEALTLLPEFERKWAETNSVVADARLNRFTTPWCHFFISYEPALALQQIKIPVLALYGELDLVVSPKQNLPVIRAALKFAGNTDYTILELPKINHAFQTCETGSDTEYAKIEETISPLVLSEISKWILDRTQ